MNICMILLDNLIFLSKLIDTLLNLQSIVVEKSLYNVIYATFEIC